MFKSKHLNEESEVKMLHTTNLLSGRVKSLLGYFETFEQEERVTDV